MTSAKLVIALGLLFAAPVAYAVDECRDLLGLCFFVGVDGEFCPGARATSTATGAGRGGGAGYTP